jgi:hypothetical protein
VTDDEVCDAESFGYRCDRQKGHGILHHHPDPMESGEHHWWIPFPHTEAENLDLSGRPWTGYLLIADVTLPFSRDSGVTITGDDRVTELWVEQVEKSLLARGWRVVPGHGLVAVMCERCNTLGCTGADCKPADVAEEGS